MKQPDMTDWVPAMLPPALAPEVLRRVAAYVEDAQDEDPRDWGDASSADKKAFFKDAMDLEWQMVAELAGHDKPVPPSILRRPSRSTRTRSPELSAR